MNEHTPQGPPIGATSVYARVTFRGADGKRHRFTGQVHREGRWLRGSRRDDVPGGQRLNLMLVAVDDVVRVDRENPHNEEWVVWPGWKPEA